MSGTGLELKGLCSANPFILSRAFLHEWLILLTILQAASLMASSSLLLSGKPSPEIVGRLVLQLAATSNGSQQQPQVMAIMDDIKVSLSLSIASILCFVNAIVLKGITVDEDRKQV